MEKEHSIRSLVDDRPLTPQEIQKLLRDENIWGNVNAPRHPVNEPPQERKSIAI